MSEKDILQQLILASAKQKLISLCKMNEKQYTVKMMLDDLARACGGHSQVSEAMVGQAIAGQWRNRGELTATYPTGDDAALEAADLIFERWENAEGASTWDEIYEKIWDGIGEFSV